MYVTSDSQKVRPVMIHRALLGSVERFTGVLIEHYAGHMPGWLSPVQIDILTIGEVSDYLNEIKEILSDYRINIDDRNLRLGEKLHNSQKNKVPIQIIVGEKDISASTLGINIHNQDNLKDVALTEAVKLIKAELKVPEFSING